MNAPAPQQTKTTDPKVLAIARRMDTIKSLAERAKPQLAQALPRHLTVDRMLKVFYSALSRPDAKGETPLLECSPISLLMSLMRAAELGLEPNTGLGLSYLVAYRNGRTGQRECQLIPGYRGLVQLARQSGAVRSIEARVVRERDRFKLAYGLDQVLEHEPLIDGGDPGSLRLVYAIAHLVDGDPVVEVMSRSEIDAIRKRSKASTSGPWVTDFDEMARKTVLRRICKFLPASTDPEHERARTALEAAVDIDTAAADGKRTLSIPSGAETMELIASAGEIPGVVVPEEDEVPPAAETTSEPTTQVETAASAPTVTADTAPKRKSPAEQMAEARAQTAEIVGQVNAFEDLGELAAWAASWKDSPLRKKLPPALKQEIDKAIDTRQAKLREDGGQDEPGANG